MKIIYTLFLLLASSEAQQNDVFINGEKELEMYLCDNPPTLSNTTLLLNSTITHVVQPGRFCLLKDLLGLSIIGPAVVKCIEPTNSTFQTGFGFKNISELTIEDVVFDSCGGVLTNESFSFKGDPLIFGGPSLQLLECDI